MEFSFHNANGNRIAELKGEGQPINEIEDAVDLLGNAEYQGAQRIIIHAHHLHPDFFDLRSGIAGDILQKFSNYRMKLAIVGDFSNIKSKALNDFIYESNKQGNILFLSSVEEAVRKI